MISSCRISVRSSRRDIQGVDDSQAKPGPKAQSGFRQVAHNTRRGLHGGPRSFRAAIRTLHGQFHADDGRDGLTVCYGPNESRSCPVVARCRPAHGTPVGRVVTDRSLLTRTVHRPDRPQDTERCCPSWYARAKVEQRAGCLSSCKSGQPWCVASNGCHRRSVPARSTEPSRA